jgi:rhamnogalacturonan endolyase
MKKVSQIRKSMKVLGVALAAACALSAGVSLANVSGGGDGKGPDVSVKDEGDSYLLDNGIVSIRVTKADATIHTFNYKGMNLFEGGHGGGYFYFSWNAPAFGGPKGAATLTVDPATTHGDYAEVTVHSPWSGKPGEAAMDVDIHYSLKRGSQGFYVTAMLEHPAAYPKVDVGEWRSNAYVSPIFDYLSVDALRQRKMPTSADYAASVPVTGAPKEVTLMTTGQYAGQFECKYSYSADLGDLNVWGWSSTSKRIGIWMTVPSHEYYNGGPMKRELTVHLDHTFLNMLNGSHYSQGTGLSMTAGTRFEKTFGPYFVYANSYQGAASDPESKVTQSLWADAQAQARAEQSAWPYTWFKNADYVQESGRGTVTGILKVIDSGNPSATANGAWVGLAPDDNGTDFQFQGRTYQFWVKADANGRFSIPHVIAGAYHLLAFGGGNIGQFDRANVEVLAGKPLDLGIVQWKPARVADTVWEIGIPDRDSHEFKNGKFNYTQWATFARSAAESDAGQTYTIGKSDWRHDWNYAQFGSGPWTINFNLANTPPKNAPASLYVALASSETTINVSLNGASIGSYKDPHPDHAPIRLGSHGPFVETRFSIPAGLLRKGANSIVITQMAKGKTTTTQYDYLRLEASGTRLAN